MDTDEVYAVPGSGSVIDFIDPETGLTRVFAHSAAEVRARHPGAVRVHYAAWAEERGSRQHAPFSWAATTEETYCEMRDVLPPARYLDGAFLVGEPTTHSVRDGKPMYEAYRRRVTPDEIVYEYATRPLTVREFADAIRGGI